MASGPIMFEFILIDGFSMTSVVTGIEPLRVANRILGEERYGWRVVHEGETPPEASNGLTLPSIPLDPEQNADYTFVCAGTHNDLPRSSRIYGVLNKRHRRGKSVGAISLAPAILARAGLLNGRRAVIHWEGRAAFEEEHPDLDLSTGLYVIDDRVITSSGGLATLDLFQQIIAAENEPWLVKAVANQLHVGRRRTEEDHQSSGQFRLPVTASKAVHKTVALIDQNLETPVSLDQLAFSVGLSRRSLERQIKATTGKTLGGFYLERRLERARDLLLHSSMGVYEVALACGFNTPTHFASRFKRIYGQSPKRWLESIAA